MHMNVENIEGGLAPAHQSIIDGLSRKVALRVARLEKLAQPTGAITENSRETTSGVELGTHSVNLLGLELFYERDIRGHGGVRRSAFFRCPRIEFFSSLQVE